MEETMLKLALDLKKAMKERKVIEIKTIRSLISALDNAGAIAMPVPEAMPESGRIAGATEGVGSSEMQRKDLSNEDVKTIIIKEINEIEKTILLIKKSETDTLEFKEQIKILKRYLN